MCCASRSHAVEILLLNWLSCPILSSWCSWSCPRSYQRATALGGRGGPHGAVRRTRVVATCFLHTVHCFLTHCPPLLQIARLRQLQKRFKQKVLRAIVKPCKFHALIACSYSNFLSVDSYIKYYQMYSWWFFNHDIKSSKRVFLGTGIVSVTPFCSKASKPLHRKGDFIRARCALGKMCPKVRDFLVNGTGACIMYMNDLFKQRLCHLAIAFVKTVAQKIRSSQKGG